MFRNILLPVDFSDQNRKSSQTTLELLQGTHAVITLLHVIEAIADTDFEEMREFYTRLESRARDGFDRLAEPLAAAGMEIERQVVYGRRVREIVHYAAEHGSDLIVMSSAAVDLRNPETAWGSISYQVAILATCPVLLVK